jgi:hypothetical protein
MKNDSDGTSKKDKKINRIKDKLAKLREKLKTTEEQQSSIPSKSKPKKIKSEIKPKEAKKKEIKVKPKEAKKKEIKVKPKEAKKKEIKVKPKEAKKKEIKVKTKEAKKKEAKIKAIKKKKAKEAKKKEAKIKAIEKKKAKEAKKKEAKIKVIEKKKAKEAKKKEEIKRKEEEKIKEEEAKKKEEEARRTYEEELEEQLTEDEITGFQLEKTDMDKMCNRVCEIIADYETDGVFQSELWKKLKLSSRDGSRLALKLERMGMITREKLLEKERWTYKLIIKKIPISTKSLEGAPCLTCPVEAKCSLDSEISPKTCQWIENWVTLELKNK